MRLSDVSIKNPVFAWMIMCGLIVFGAISFTRLGVSQTPDVDMPFLNVSVSLTGAAPEVIEQTVVEPLENVLSTTEGIKSLSSNSKTGNANISVEFELEKDIDIAFQEVQAKVSQAMRALPRDMDTPIVTKTNPDDQPIIWLALSYDKNDPQFLMSFARDYLRQRFTTIPGVGDIFLGGYTDPALRVWVKPESLTKNNMAVNDVIDAISSEHQELPGGFLENTQKISNIRTLGEADTVEEFKKISIARRAGISNQDPTKQLKISDVANVELGLDDIRRISRFNEQPAIGLGIRKQRGSNAVAVADAVKKKLTEIQSELPSGMKINVNFDSTKFIKDSVSELNKHLLFAVLLTSLVCWLFLGSWSATFNVLLSIPTSIFGTFICLYFFGMTLNTFTLLGLTLAIGIIVDDAIMVLENIFRYNEKGYNRIESSILGSREIAFAALAATLAVVAIFLPVAFMKGVIGKFFLHFGLTISVAVMLSLLEALTITPMRCANFVSQNERTSAFGKAFESGFKKLSVFYSQLLIKTLDYKWSVIIGSTVFVVLSFFIVKFLKKEMTPSSDISMFIARVSLPIGTSIANTNERSKELEKWFLDQPEIKSVYAAIGGFGGAASDSNIIMMFVSMKEPKDRGLRSDPKNADRKIRLNQQEFFEVARKELKKFTDVKVSLRDLSQGGFGGGRGFPIEFTISGFDWKILSESAKKVIEEMKKSEFVTDVDSNLLEGMPELQIIPDRKKAAERGVSISTIGKTVNALVGGTRVGQYSSNGHRNDIKVQLLGGAKTIEDLKKIKIANQRGNLIPLSDVVELKQGTGLQSISRENRQRSISIFANLKPKVSQQKAMAFLDGLNKKTLPDGYVADFSGGSKSMGEAFRGLMFALVMGFLVAYMILAAQFNSFLDPVAILMSMPFSFSGAFAALFISQQSLNMYSFIGLLLLMGIVKKNSILLVEFANQIRELKNIKAREALIEACPVRLRPILMTSFATIAGAIPSALALGAGSENVRPMAICIIGGVFVSTFLTLFVVPCVYLALDKLKKSHRNNLAIKEAFAKVGG